MSDVVQATSGQAVAPVTPAVPSVSAATPTVAAKPVAPAKKVVRRAPVKKPATGVATPAKKAIAKPAAKTVAKSVTKPAAKPVAKQASAAAKKTVAKPVVTVSKPVANTPPTAAKTAAVAPKVEKAAKPKKLKMIRDSFTIPKDEMAVIDVLKTRALKLAHPIKKSELIRAGIKVLAAISDNAFLAAMKAVPVIKTGRPGK